MIFNDYAPRTYLKIRLIGHRSASFFPSQSTLQALALPL